MTLVMRHNFTVPTKLMQEFTLSRLMILILIHCHLVTQRSLMFYVLYEVHFVNMIEKSVDITQIPTECLNEGKRENKHIHVLKCSWRVTQATKRYAQKRLCFTYSVSQSLCIGAEVVAGSI